MSSSKRNVMMAIILATDFYTSFIVPIPIIGIVLLGVFWDCVGAKRTAVTMFIAINTGFISSPVFQLLFAKPFFLTVIWVISATLSTLLLLPIIMLVNYLFKNSRKFKFLSSPLR